MTGATVPPFTYVTYIRAAPERVWAAITDPAFIRRYWFGMHVDSAFTPGAPWSLTFEDGRLADTGEILEAEPPRRLVIRWRNVFREELAAEGWSRCVFEIEAAEGAATRLEVRHGLEGPGSEFVKAVGTGWPKILSALKTLLETDGGLFA